MLVCNSPYKYLKMKKSILVAISLLLLFTFSCKESPNQMEAVMQIHDEVMPKMGKLSSLMGDLDTKMKTEENTTEYSKAKVELQNAHDSMMDWMMNFGKRFDSDEIMNGKALTEEKQKWLDEEETKVKALKTQINSSIEKAEALLK